MSSRLQCARALLSLGICVLHAACGTSAASVYPLNEGWEWVYEVSLSSRDQQRVTVMNLASREVVGKKVTPQRIQTTNLPDYSEIEFVLSDEGGIGLYGVQRPGDVAPSLHEAPHYYFRYPLRRGAAWTDTIPTVFMFPHLPLLEVRTEIAAIDDDVTVAAGTFRDCVTLITSGVGAVRGSDAVVTLEEHRWYCRGVGLVRMVRNEGSSSPALPGGTRDMYLVTLRRP